MKKIQVSQLVAKATFSVLLIFKKTNKNYKIT